LVGVTVQPKPKEVKVIGHEAISRAEKSFTGGGVKHDFPEPGMKRFIKPTSGTLSNGHRPMNDGVALVKFGGQSWEVMCMDFTIHGIERSFDIQNIGVSLCKRNLNDLLIRAS
jgi:hypothetical protein